MVKETVIANKNGKEVGKKEIEIPQTLAEAVKIIGGEEKVVHVIAQYLKNVARNTLSKPAPDGGITKKVAKYEVYKNLLAAKIAPADALKFSGLTTEDVKAVETYLKGKAA